MKYMYGTTHKLLGSVVAAALIASGLAPAVAIAQSDNGLTFEFQPHCEARDDNPDSCETFDVRDPESLQTDMLQVGDTIDVDLVINNPDRVPVSRFRVWAAYDPSIVTGTDIEISDDFSTPIPGEDDFDTESANIKISGTADNAVDDEVIFIARLTMTVTEARIDGTPIVFFDDTRTEDRETAIYTSIGTGETNVSSATHGYLFIRLEQEQAVSSSSSSVSSESSVTSTSSIASESPISSESSTVFTLLQVQGVRVTTEGSSAYLAWDTLPSSDLAGYNLYYGTVSGKYIQKRSVDASATSITIRALPVGSFYYFAVRGVNGSGQETEFSQEVAVGIGDPSSSTSPLLAGSIPTGTPGTNGNLAGDTGPVTTILLFVVVCAFAGTLIAFRRQLIASDSN